MKILATQLEGCFEIQPFFVQDERGTFVKTFNADLFADLGLPTDWREEYYSCSRKGVIRGMHFQTPPYDHEKLVYCMQGRVLDVVLDLRRESLTFGRHVALELDAASGHGLMIPKGMAHGFLALTNDALLAYKVTTVHSPTNDMGIHWNTFGLDWGVMHPTLSARDDSHPALADFVSPF